ncbi:MAG: DUF2961 domain-containing protein [Chitinophagaceae bacterium]|nr:MAG: DUF2961 domain-containing protein [Chitinophagaceae bacterium]
MMNLTPLYKIRKLFFQAFYIFILVLLSSQLSAQAPIKPPTLPIGLDAYRQWSKWPIQRIGVRAYMRSTYDRTGGNEGADASHFLFMKGENDNVTLDVKGKGILYFMRFNHWHGSPWHFKIDGKDNVVKETATADPIHAQKRFNSTDFIPSKPFPAPLAYTWSTTKGADLIWTPMPFKHSLQIAYSRTHYGTGYYIYDLYANNNLSEPVRSWNIKTVPDRDVLQLINKSGTDIAPKNIKRISGKLKPNKKGKLLLANIQSPFSVIRAFKLTLPLKKAIDLERLRIVVTWDHAKYPSIDAPLCLFFGAGTLYNRDHHQYMVKGFPINIKYDYVNEKVTLACYYPMPFFKSAHFEITGTDPDDTGTEIGYEIRYEPWNFAPNQSSYFHATYQDFPHPEPGKDLVLLDTRGIEGHKEWSGSFVGTSFIFSRNGDLNTLEGDPRFFFDDSQTPQAYGTGTEEWAGGGDYWGGQNMTLPFAGHPCGAVSKETAKNKKDLIESGYRFLLADLMPFGRRAVIHLEHGGENLSTEHYETVTYWYGLPSPSLIKTDEMDVGNLQSEKAHHYYSPQASDIEKITSRYELGIDTFPAHPRGTDPDKIPGYKNKAGKEVYPAQEKDGRYTRGTSAFTVEINPANDGVLLRRTLDYSFPNQKAKVYIADVHMKADSNDPEWKYAGIWYLAGSNTCVYSNPEGEPDKRFYKVETSDRRFRDDEFLLPARLTEGHSKIRVKIEFVPSDQELYPGMPFPKKGAWSELKYDVYSYVMPDFQYP